MTSDTTKIEWTATRLEDGTTLPGYTFNPWWGCVKVSEACKHCYAESFSKRTGHKVWGNVRRRFFGAKHWNEPLRWNQDAGRKGIRRKVFCASMADVFELLPDDHGRALDIARARLWELIMTTPNLDWLLLTKRPENVLSMVPDGWRDLFPPHVWVGATAENQARYDERLEHLVRVPTRIRFLSMEPLLERVNLGLLGIAPKDWVGGHYAPVGSLIHWVIVGGESGHHSRPFDLAWAQDIRQQCRDASVRFFMKQTGERPILEGQPLVTISKKGSAIIDLPASIRIRQWPE